MSDFAEITYSTQQVVCEHPRLIINPLLPELIAKYHTYFLRGRLYCNRAVHVHYFNFNYRPFSIKRNNITREDIPSSFVVDEVTGETFPIYIEVPCNKCDVCKDRKIASFVQRCKLETQVYNTKPWFITLTYAPEHKPSSGLSIEEAQKYLKRLRINLVRSGFKNKVRYVLVGEYGKPPHLLQNGRLTEGYRPHYHMILWNIGAKSHQEYLKVSSILDKSWSKGFIQHRIINPENDRAFYYTSKYLRKDCHVPEGCNPTFMLSSRGHGGIGSKFLDCIAPELRHTLNTKFQYLNKWNNKVEDLIFSQYVLNRVFPSWSKSVPSALRRALADFGLGASHYLQTCNDLFTSQIKQYHDLFSDIYSRFVYYPMLSFGDYSKKMLQVVDTTADGLLRLADRINKFPTPDFEEAQKIHEKRGLFCSKLFFNSVPVDIAARAYRARRNAGFASARLQI